MKLYYSAGSCSMSCHMGLEESGLKYQAIQVDWSKPDQNLADLERLNPLGVVPVLITQEGKALTQNAAILEVIADLKPESKLLAPVGSPDRAETLAWLSFVAADLHKSYSPLFGLQAISPSESTQSEVREWAKKNVHQHLAHVDAHLAGRDYLMGKTFTIADCYLFTVVGWSKWVGVKMDAYPNLNAYQDRVYQRPAVQAVLQAEGLLD
ncbi:MAG: glutathione S-transferase family protein [Bdellovibrionales bacterium]|nr:glutathione S-transferase family protein [Bdellovibrionales bacterium]